MSATRTMAKMWLLAVFTLVPVPVMAQGEAAPQTLPSLGKDTSLPDKANEAAPSGAFNQVLQAGCATCGGGLLGAGPEYSSGGCSDGNCTDGCFPGAKKCCPCEGNNCITRTLCAFQSCLCCPDPCYEPHWIAGANAAFFVDSARPVTQMRLRWDNGRGVINPDRAEFFWAKEGGKGPKKPETKLNYNSLSIYNEAAIERFSVFTEMPYLAIRPEQNLGASGFGDLKIGTKSLLVDCELMQIAFQMVTSVPTGNFLKGLGVGHVSLEPSLLATVKICADTYAQGQISEWIPIGGTGGYAGSMLHYHLSLNHVICRPLGDSQLIATFEFNGYTFQSGSYTDASLAQAQLAAGTVLPAGQSAGQLSANSYTYMSIGPGLRYVICDKIDFGVGSAFSVTNQHFADQLIRTEFRWRF